MLVRWLGIAVVLFTGVSTAADKGPLETDACLKAKQKMDADFTASSKDVDVRATGVCMFYPQLISKAKAKVQYLTSCPAADEGGQLTAAQAEIVANEAKMRGCKK